ncbi:LamG domain-containing protein [Sphingomonas sp.]|jgi:hypothetical protein|uniref:LamG domain-containing protein n=1 Tax=Sphingomonas sp. TaxID=28214 RepID=UPI002ED844CC
MYKLDRRGLLAGGVGAACVAPLRALATPKARVWTFDNLRGVWGLSVEIAGAPKLVASPFGKAMAFDGVDDGVFIGAHPLAGAKQFTFEAVFRPEGGAFEQRWFHLESDEQPAVAPGKGSTRMLFEIRVVEDRWYLDAFMVGQGYRQTMMAPEKTFPIGAWYHVAQSYDGTTYRSFVDGQLQMEVATPFTPQGPGRASAGMRMNRVNPFNGAIREARFTHTALGPAEFTRLTN